MIGAKIKDNDMCSNQHKRLAEVPEMSNGWHTDLHIFYKDHAVQVLYRCVAQLSQLLHDYLHLEG